MEESERRSQGGVNESGVGGRRDSGSRGPRLARRRVLDGSQHDDASLGYEYPASHSAGLEIISKHTDQIHLEFVVKMAIACVVLVCLVVWFIWSFWRDSRRRRGSHGRSVSRLDSQLERPGSLDSSVGTSGSITSSAPAAYQRDAVALGDQDQDGSVVTEFLNPLWVAGRHKDGADTAVAGSVDARGEFVVGVWGGVMAKERERQRTPLLLLLLLLCRVTNNSSAHSRQQCVVSYSMNATCFSFPSLNRSYIRLVHTPHHTFSCPRDVVIPYTGTACCRLVHPASATQDTFNFYTRCFSLYWYPAGGT